jgi:hypothetical protein
MLTAITSISAMRWWGGGGAPAPGVASPDATGLGNPAVWVALERKGLIKSMFPHAAIVTTEGMDYDTGLQDRILHRSDH